MTNLCMTLQIGATFDHPLVDLKNKEYAIVKNNKYMYIHVHLMSLIRCIFKLKSVTPPLQRGKNMVRKISYPTQSCFPGLKVVCYLTWSSYILFGTALEKKSDATTPASM